MLSVELSLMLLRGRIAPSQPGGGLVPAHPAIKHKIAAAMTVCRFFMVNIDLNVLGYLDGGGGALPPRFMYMSVLAVLMM